MPLQAGQEIIHCLLTRAHDQGIQQEKKLKSTVLRIPLVPVVSGAAHIVVNREAQRKISAKIRSPFQNFTVAPRKLQVQSLKSGPIRLINYASADHPVTHIKESFVVETLPLIHVQPSSSTVFLTPPHDIARRIITNHVYIAPEAYGSCRTLGN